MIVIRRKFDFCSIFLRKHRWLLYVESILIVQPLYVSSKNKKENNNNFYPCTTRFATYNMGCKVHGHNFMRLFFCITFHVVRPISRLLSHQSVHPINQKRKVRVCTNAIMTYFLKMGPSMFSMSLFSWIWRRLCLVLILTSYN